MFEKTIYTIGHSTHEINYFLELIQGYSINCIVDVRSIPNSSYAPQYNKLILESYLTEKNIQYMHFKEEFGAIHTDPKVLDRTGKVNFEKVRETNAFLSGVDRLRVGVEKGFSICLMCSESEPFDCHRFSLISYFLVRKGFQVKHILKDGSSIPNSYLELRLLEKYKKKIPEPNLFKPVISDDEKLRLAYELRNKDVAYSDRKELNK